MFTEEQRAKFRQRFAAYKNGKKPYDAGRPVLEDGHDWSYGGWKQKVSKYLGIDIDHDNTYDYEGYFNKYPKEAWAMLKGDPRAHFTDEFKTVYHPTFSQKSKNNDGSVYSGVVHPKYNPQGLVGGIWSPDYKTFTMSSDGYRGPVNMDDRRWYLENNEDNGVILREANGNLPVYDGVIWGGVLPNVAVTGHKLPKYGGGKEVLDNSTNAKFNDDGTFTDDTTRLFDDIIITPKGLTTKYGSYTDKNWDRYKLLESFYGRYDLLTGKLKFEPGLEIVSPEFDVLSFMRGIGLLANKSVAKKIQKPSIYGSKSTSNPFKLNGSDFDKDANDIFKAIKRISLQSKLRLIEAPKPDPVNDPYGIIDLASDVIHHEGMPNGVEDIFRYLILPRTNINPLEYDRTISVLSKYGYNTLDDYNWAKYLNDHTAGYLDGSTKGIALRGGYIDYAGAHEFRHRMLLMIPYKRSLSIDRESYLNKAYGDDFVNLPKYVDPSDNLYGYELMADEAATTNLDARKWAFNNFSDNPELGKLPVKEQNEFLDKLTDDLIIEAVVNSNGYGKRYIHFLEQKYHLLDNPKLNAQYANWFRNAMKYYGVSAIPVTMSIKNTRNEPRNK